MRSMVSDLILMISRGIILGALLSAAPALAQSIAEKVEVCAGCHGQDGKPIDTALPIIWGQQAGYIYIQLRDFKRGDRKNEIMQPIVSSFEKDDMLAIAEYFAQKPWPNLGQPRSPKDVAQRALGAEHSVGCTGCHLEQFQGAGTTPRLAGQSQEYLAKTIADFRTRARGNNPGMSDLMRATSPDDLAALAEYLAGL
ncbi:cytochrome c [Bradyrhizobium neotropicale]|uniref:Cytochrome c n=2 Tax=Bradyrhizobium neotropicale TaxID=1497615 RepID=A0A176YK63_9BRAD|nr:cytochrome c [Bradyrhizobium neotropicale]